MSRLLIITTQGGIKQLIVLQNITRWYKTVHTRSGLTDVYLLHHILEELQTVNTSRSEVKILLCSKLKSTQDAHFLRSLVLGGEHCQPEGNVSETTLLKILLCLHFSHTNYQLQFFCISI